tara:strand:+ start:568 stop:795 length:228 start_codon:yes stop_codon:yes gene_type:complete
MLENQKKRKNQLNSYVKYSSLTVQMAVIISAGAFSGDYLDKTLKTEYSIYTLILSLSSIFFALYYMFRRTVNRND